MDGPHTASDISRQGFKLATISNLDELENGLYWPRLRPYFLRPDYKRLRYTIQGGSADLPSPTAAVSVRGANRTGELDIAFIADHVAATMSISDAGIDDYCLTLVSRGHAVYTGAARLPHVLDPERGLIYRGDAGTSVAASGGHERLSIWIPRASMTQRLSALLESPVPNDAEFSPTFDLASSGLRHLVGFLVGELQSPTRQVLGSAAASRSMADLLIYTLLRSTLHSHSDKLSKAAATPAPRTLRRAEAFIRANLEAPIALHEVAAAAGCSVRSLQAAFRSFRDTTPLLAIRNARLEAARDAMRSGKAGATVTEVALTYGFANPGRFTRLYREAFGESPKDTLHR